MLVGIFANGLALLRLLAGPERRFTGWKMGFALMWSIAVGTAFWQVNNPLHSGAMLRQQKEYAVEQKNVVRGFLSSDNVAPLQEFDRRTHRFPHFDLTLKLLRDPDVQPYLPPSLSTDARKGPLSRLASEVPMTWIIWMGIGVCLLLFGALRTSIPSSGASAKDGMRQGS
ncbi:MAG TPA: hypothetical protein VGM64_14885 [Lacunisphaera sp.]